MTDPRRLSLKAAPWVRLFYCEDKVSLKRPRYTAVHGLGHFIGTRNSPESFEKNESFESVEERYADYFGQSFLAPQDCFSKAFHSLSEGCDRPSRRLVIMLANKFGVSLKFCVQRLEHLGLVKRGIWDWFLANGGLKKTGERSFR